MNQTAASKIGNGHGTAPMSKKDKDKKHKKHDGKAFAKRQRLLSRVAGNVASGVVQSPSPSITSSDAIAQVAIDIAEAILQKAGL